MPEAEHPFVHSLQNLAQEAYPTNSNLPTVDENAANVLIDLQHFEIDRPKLTNSHRAEYLALSLVNNPRVDKALAVETAAWMAVKYKPFQSWAEQDVRLFFAMTLVHMLGTIQKVFYEADKQEKVYSALFPTNRPQSQIPVSEVFDEMQEKYSSLLGRVLERVGDPPADLRRNK